MVSEKGWQEWYAVNGEELNDARRERYKTDPAYRAQVLEANRKVREARRRAKAEQAKTESAAVKAPAIPRGFKVLETSGKGRGKKKGPPQKLFSIGALAGVLGCSAQAIRLWEKKGLIKPPAHFSPKHDRLYTLDEIEIIRARFQAEGRMCEIAERNTEEVVKREVVLADGSQAAWEFFRVGVLARALDRTVVTVSQLEDRGRLPETPFRASQTRYRLYTASMIRAVKEVFDTFGGRLRGAPSWDRFRAAVLARWRDLGVLEVKLAS